MGFDTDLLLLFAGTLNAANVYVPQLVTALGATAGANVIDAGPLAANQSVDYGAGENLDVTFNIMQTLTSGGAATVQFQLVQADDNALTVNVQVLNQTDAVPFATLVAGVKVPLHWDRAAPYVPPKRFLGVRTVIGTAVLTNATGWLIAGAGKNFADMGIGGRGPVYKSGFSIA